MYIYVLVDPRDSEIRYVGKTADLSERLKSHKYVPSSSNSHRYNWLRKLKNLGHISDLRIELVQELDAVHFKAQ